MATKLKRPIKEYLPLFDTLVEKILDEEEKQYHNDLVPFNQHAQQVREQLLLSEKLYLERIQKAVKLLEKRFGQQDKLLIFLKV